MMHGIIHAELKRFVSSNYGNDAWIGLLREAGLGDRTYLAGQAYPDEEIVALVGAASRKTGIAAGPLLEAFGAFMVPSLVKVYGPLIKPQWRTLELIEHTEETIHKVVRRKNPGALPPRLGVSRRAPDEVVLAYASARKLCAVAKGIVRGLAEHYKENVVITASACMSEGKPECLISVKRVA